MQVELNKPALAKYVDEKVKAGEFPSAEAVVEDALLRVMEEDESLSEDDLRAIEASEEQIARGERVDFDTFAAKMRKKFGVGE